MRALHSSGSCSPFGSLYRNQVIKRMEKINAIVNLSKIKSLVVRGYFVGKSTKKGKACHFLLLLQQWYHMDSNLELDTKINVRSRSSKDTTKAINHELLPQFASRGLAINRPDSTKLIKNTADTLFKQLAFNLITTIKLHCVAR